MATVNVRDEYDALHQRADFARDRAHFELARVYELLASLLQHHSADNVLEDLRGSEGRIKKRLKLW